MRYTVIWIPIAINKLVTVWMTAPDPQAVSLACNRIDRELAVDPDQKGTIIGGDRYLAELPLAVIFNVIPDDRRVEVIDDWHL